MTKPTQCSIDGCTGQPYARGWCSHHYARWFTAGTPHRKCQQCGSEIPIKSTGGHNYCSQQCREGNVPDSRLVINRVGKYVRRCVTCGSPTPNNRGKYCSEQCWGTCAAPGCDRKYLGKYCDGHAQRVRKYGTPVMPCTECGLNIGLDRFPKATCSDACDPRCVEPGCEREPWLTDRCATHEAREKRRQLLAEYRNRATGRACPVCEKPINGGPLQRYCSVSCTKFANRHPDIQAALWKQCVGCGEQFSILEVLEEKRTRRRANVADCHSCSSRNFHIYRIHKDAVLDSRGTDCGLCGDSIDLDLAWPHPQSLSIDHIIPWSVGGSHDLENLQPAHLICNAKKQDRVGFKIA